MSIANDYKFSSTNLIGVGSLPPANFVLHQRGEEVGRFQVVDGVMCFTGNTDAAAKVMVDYFLKQFNEQIKAYGQQCREAALEQAAQVCEALITDCGDSNVTRYECANAIRKMIGEIK